MTNKKNQAQNKLKEWLSDAIGVVVVGIGNPIRMDDFVGVRVAQKLHGKVSEKVYLIECETIPESYIEQIADFNPSHVLLIDAALLRLKPGDFTLIEPEQLQMFPVYSTHFLPLRIFCEYLASMANAKIALLLIQPENTDFGEGLTPKLEASADEIATFLLENLP